MSYHVSYMTLFTAQKIQVLRTCICWQLVLNALKCFGRKVFVVYRRSQHQTSCGTDAQHQFAIVEDSGIIRLNARSSKTSSHDIWGCAATPGHIKEF